MNGHPTRLDCRDRWASWLSIDYTGETCLYRYSIDADLLGWSSVRARSWRLLRLLNWLLHVDRLWHLTQHGRLAELSQFELVRLIVDRNSVFGTGDVTLTVFILRIQIKIRIFLGYSLVFRWHILFDTDLICSILLLDDIAKVLTCFIDISLWIDRNTWFVNIGVHLDLLCLVHHLTQTCPPN